MHIKGKVPSRELDTDIDKKKVNLIIIVDISGSMSGSPIRQVRTFMGLSITIELYWYQSLMLLITFEYIFLGQHFLEKDNWPHWEQSSCCQPPHHGLQPQRKMDGKWHGKVNFNGKSEKFKFFWISRLPHWFLMYTFSQDPTEFVQDQFFLILPLNIDFSKKLCWLCSAMQLSEPELKMGAQSRKFRSDRAGA